jgi:AcrR family transcriptional regulator
MSKGQRTRREIIDKAYVLAGDLGLEALSIGALANETGLSKSGLFAHFKSKEALQLEVIEEVRSRFANHVIRPALEAPRGEPRVRTFFEHYLRWIDTNRPSGGCMIMSLSHEYDDRPGPIRDLLVASQFDFLDVVRRMAQGGKEEGHFRPDLDVDQFAFEVFAIEMAYQHQSKFMKLPDAMTRARNAFDSVLERSRKEPTAPN